MYYIIATFNGNKNASRRYQRTHTHPNVGDVLSTHLESLETLKHKCNVVVSIAESSNTRSEYYANIKNFNTIQCKNYGYSMGQWLNAYEKLEPSNYYIFVEDDYCFNKNNFEMILLKHYKNKFKDNIGLLCSIVEGGDGRNPVHFEGFVFVSRETMEKMYNFVKTPITKLTRVENYYPQGFKYKYDTFHYKGGYFQMAFSQLFNASGIKHDDIMELLYWDDDSGSILKFTDRKNHTRNFELDNQHLFNPVQLYKPEYISFHCKKRVIVFVDECDTSRFFKRGFSISKGPGKSEIEEYRKFINEQFGKSKLCVVKESKLNLMLDFIKDVCKNEIFMVFFSEALDIPQESSIRSLVNP